MCVCAIRKLYEIYKVIFWPSKCIKSLKCVGTRLYFILLWKTWSTCTWITKWSKKYYGSCNFLSYANLKRNSISISLIFKYDKLQANETVMKYYPIPARWPLLWEHPRMLDTTFRRPGVDAPGMQTVLLFTLCLE